MRLDDFRVDDVAVDLDGNVIAPFVPFFRGRILAFDQALANTGWVLVNGNPWRLYQTGAIRTSSVFQGHVGNLSRQQDLREEVGGLIETWNPDLIVHETPPVGGRMQRPESSLLGASAIWSAALDRSVPLCMVSAQTAKKRLCDIRDADKRMVRKGLEQLLPETVFEAKNKKMQWNEHVRDALALAVVASEDVERYRVNG